MDKTKSDSGRKSIICTRPNIRGEENTRLVIILQVNYLCAYKTSHSFSCDANDVKRSIHIILSARWIDGTLGGCRPLLYVVRPRSPRHPIKSSSGVESEQDRNNVALLSVSPFARGEPSLREGLQLVFIFDISTQTVGITLSCVMF